MKLLTSLVVVTVLANLSHLKSVEASRLPEDQTTTLLESTDQEGYTDVTAKNTAENDNEDDISFENDKDEDPDWRPVEYDDDDDDDDDDDNDDGDNDDDGDDNDDGDNDDNGDDKDDGDNGNDYGEDSDGDNNTEETSEDPLWLSDDDPDWNSEEYDDEDYSEDVDPEYEELLQQVAQMLQSTAQSLPEEGISETRRKQTQNIIDSIRDTIPTKTAARSFLNQLLLLASENNKHVNEISEEDVSTYGEVDDQDQSHEVPSNKVRRHAHQHLDQIRQYQSAKGQSPVGLIRETLDNGEGEVDGDRTISEFGYPGSGQVDNSQLSQGVEPLGPQLQKEVGEGVEPEDASGVGDRGDRPSFLRWLEKGWGQVTDTVDNLGDKAEDTLSQWGDKIADAADTVHKAASQVVDKVQDAAQSTGDKIATAFQRAKEELPNLQATILSAFSKFGTLIQQGARYCLQRLTHTFDQVRGSEILDKLERKLTEGNAQVAKLFQMLGQKVSEWKQEQVGENVDEGLIIHHHEEHSKPQDNAHIEEAMPNFFEDDPIRQQLEKLVDVGVLTPDDIKVFYQQQQEEQQQDPEMENYLQPDQ
nr:dentin sialophosphoprotein-like [Cherax quadricarinatus]